MKMEKSKNSNSKKIMLMMNLYRILTIVSIICESVLIGLVVSGYVLGRVVSIGMMLLSVGVVSLFLFRFVLAFQMDSLKKVEFKNMMENVVKSMGIDGHEHGSESGITIHRIDRGICNHDNEDKGKDA